MVTQGSPVTEPHSPVDGSMRKRVCKACDRCRLKKSKCDGLSVCSRCRADNAICVFGERKKSHDKVYPKGYVEMLEQQQAQLVAGLQELYRRLQKRNGWEGAPLQESSHGFPLTHDLLESLGALKSSRNNSGAEHFEEDLRSLQRRLLADGAEFMQRSHSDSGSDSGHSPTSDPLQHKVPFTDPFSFSKLPPTPPTNGPFPKWTSPAIHTKNHEESRPSSLQKATGDRSLQGQSWASPGLGLDDNVDLSNQYDSPVSLDAVSNPFDALQMPIGTIAPYLSMRDWNRDVDFHRFFTSAAM